MDEGVPGVAGGEFPREGAARRTVPDRLGGEGQFAARRGDVVLLQADHPDAGGLQPGVHRADRGEQADADPPGGEPQGGFDRDLGLAAVDRGVVCDEDDVHVRNSAALIRGRDLYPAAVDPP